MTLPPNELIYLARYGYLALFVIIVMGEFVSYLPIGIVLIAVGALVKQGYFNVFISLVVAMIAGSVGDVVVYFVARRLGRRAGYQRFIERNRFAGRIHTYMRTFPRLTILISRFIGVATTPVNALAGLSQMSFPEFLLFDMLGNAICASIYLSVGYFLGAAWSVSAETTVAGIGILAALVLIGYLVFNFLRRKKDDSST